MHPNPIFRKEPDARNLQFARKRAFGVLSINGEDGPLISHIPFLLADDGATLEFHLMRSNALLRSMPCKGLLAVSGPDSYISPDWYDVKDQVPTWNYVAVHLRGSVEQMPQEGMHDMLGRESAHFEQELSPKTPWTTSKMTPEVLERMMRQIVPCKMHIESVDATWKLGQNKPDAARLKAGAEVGRSGIGQEVQALSALMLEADKE